MLVFLQVIRENNILGVSSIRDEGNTTSPHSGNTIKPFRKHPRMASIKIDLVSINECTQRHLIPLNHLKAPCRDEPRGLSSLLHSNPHSSTPRLGRFVIKQQSSLAAPAHHGDTRHLRSCERVQGGNIVGTAGHGDEESCGYGHDDGH